MSGTESHAPKKKLHRESESKEKQAKGAAADRPTRDDVHEQREPSQAREAVVRESEHEGQPRSGTSRTSRP